LKGLRRIWDAGLCHFCGRGVISGIVPAYLSSFVALMAANTLTLFSKGLKAQSEKETNP
jgi:hypothetical protein